MNHFRAWWPIPEPRMSLDDLAHEATTHHLPDLLRRNRLRATGWPRWSIRHGRDLPGTGGAHLVLVADIPVVTVARAQDEEGAA